MRTDPSDLPGLQAPADITIDRWGIPHLRAENLQDLFFLQGYNAARDRLWQIDLWRKRGLGLLAESFGPGYLAQDRASRLFLYRGDMAAEWAVYVPDAAEICACFVNGINAFIGMLDDTSLPIEFRLTKTRPAPWRPEDVVRIRSHALMRNALSEVIRANVLSALPAEVDLLRQHLEPARTPHRAEGLDLASIPLEVLDVFKLAVAGVSFEDARLSASLGDAGAWSKVAVTGEIVRDSAFQGSNNWVVHGSRTTSGRPILANDPHRLQAIPSLRYLVHLTAPGFDAIGAGEPCLPGISIGHNGTIAFGLTIFTGSDQEDVYVYETAPGDPDLYRYGGGWERIHRLEEHAGVRGAADQTHRLAFTRHGPVVFEDPANHRAYAVRTIGLEPGAAPYFGSIRTMRARSLQEFREGMTHWAVPASNQVYADVEGTIAWMPTAFSPIRRNWDGLLPVPGDGRYEWSGYYTAADLPMTVDPAAGFIATANEPNLPADWPHAHKPIGYEWLERSRMNRITAVLASGPQSVAASCALQTDAVSLPAQRLMTLVSGLAGAGAVGDARALWSGWDRRIDAGSAAAALFEVWWNKHLRPGVLAEAAGSGAASALLLPGHPESILALLESPDQRLGADPVAARDRLLAETLAKAWADCAERLGPDVSAWRWGDLHKGMFVHALSAIGTGATRLDVGPFAKGGSDSTPMNAMYRLSDFRVTHGASVRLVVDVGAWDNSRCINAPGQSGDPASPHYGDLAPLWAEGGYVPLLYSRARIEAEAERRLSFVPAGTMPAG